MKPSARVALIAALAATTAPTWASLPFYSPDYTFDSTTGTGFKGIGLGGISPDGKVAYNFQYHESNIALNRLVAVWRGQTPLPTPQGDNEHADPYASGGINRHGWISGRTKLNGGGYQPALWRPDGTRIDLPSPPPIPGQPAQEYVFGMNDAGFVVGRVTNYNELESFGSRPVYWTSSSEIVELANPFATLNPFWHGEAKSISSTGIIAGNVYDGPNYWRAMRWDINGTAQILSQTTNTGITFTHSEAYESLDDGTVVGFGRISDRQYGALWTPDGEAIELRNLPNATEQFVEISDVNNSHFSVGAARLAEGQRVGVRWSPTGEPFALDQLPDAPANTNGYVNVINDFNFAVGSHYASSAYWRAVLWTPDGDAIDMNSLVESNEWILDGATTITNTGWISGIGKFDPAGPAELYRRPFSILVPFAGTYGMGDANFDESIDFADLLIVAQNYGTETNGSFDVGDFNLDGSVNFTDLLAIAQHYGTVMGDVFTLLPNSPNPTFESDWQVARGMVPEPAATSVILAGLGILRRRRRAYLVPRSSRLVIRFTPKYRSWLNVAEIELSVMTRQCLDRRMG